MHHHDRPARVDYTPAATPSERSFWAAFLDLFRIRRNAQDARQAKAAEANRPIREAEARRALSQPGVSPEAAAKAAKFLTRAKGAARLLPLAIILLAAVAIGLGFDAALSAQAAP